MGAYDNLPSWPAGHIILDSETAVVLGILAGTGPNGGVLDADSIVKASGTARVNNTMSADPDLTVNLAANATYRIEFHILFEGLTAAGFRTLWIVPSGVTTGSRSCLGPGSSAADTAADNIAMHAGLHNYGTIESYGTRNSAAAGSYAYERGIVTTTSAGTLALSWAQVTTNATATTLMGGSEMIVTRLA